MNITFNGEPNFSRLAKVLERLHKEETGEDVSFTIRKMTDEEKAEYEEMKTKCEKRVKSAWLIHQTKKSLITL